MRAVTHTTVSQYSPRIHLEIDLIGNERLPLRERPGVFGHRPVARKVHRVTNTEYSVSSPSSVLARSRA